MSQDAAEDIICGLIFACAAGTIINAVVSYHLLRRCKGEKSQPASLINDNDDDFDYYATESTLANAKHFFPDLDLDLEYVKRYSKKSIRFRGVPTEFIKYEVKMHVEDKLDEMDQQKRERLVSKRENAEELRLELGMNPEVVKAKVEETRNIEKEFGFKFTAPILDSIHYLIQQLDCDFLLESDYRLIL